MQGGKVHMEINHKGGKMPETILAKFTNNSFALRSIFLSKGDREKEIIVNIWSI